MPVKDVTPTLEKTEAILTAVDLVSRDIREQWPRWVEIAKLDVGKFSSPYMLVATQLLSMSIMAMLWADMTRNDVVDSAKIYLDFVTDPEIHRRFTEVDDEDKDGIIRLVNSLAGATAVRIAEHKVKN